MEELAYFTLGVGIFCATSGCFYLGFRYFMKDDLKSGAESGHLLGDNVGHARQAPELIDTEGGRIGQRQSDPETTLYSRSIAFFSSFLFPVDTRRSNVNELTRTIQELQSTIGRIMEEKELVAKAINQKFLDILQWNLSKSEYDPQKVQQAKEMNEKVDAHYQKYAEFYNQYPEMNIGTRPQAKELKLYALELEEHHTIVTTAAHDLVRALNSYLQILESSVQRDEALRF